MATHYELLGEVGDVFSDLVIEPKGMGWPHLSDRLMLNGMLWWFTPLLPGGSGAGEAQSDAKTLAPEAEWAPFG